MTVLKSKELGITLRQRLYVCREKEWVQKCHYTGSHDVDAEKVQTASKLKSNQKLYVAPKSRAEIKVKV